ARLRARGGAGDGTGAAAALLTRGVAAAEPYLTKYVPALVLAGVVPALTVVAIASQDLMSAAIVLFTLPLVPVFGALVGLATRDRAAIQWRALESLSGHFVDVVRGLPTLVAFRRARAQSGRIGELTDRYRRASLGTLRVAFASSAVLELVATLSVALVAVTVGLRLAAGHLELGTALVVLLLAPEAYWPLRRVGAEFHASAEGAETFVAITALEESAAEPAEHPEGASRQELSADSAGLVLDRVSVLRPGRAVPALDGVTLTVPDRGLTALVGPSGCGKSTLLAVAAGQLPPTAGRVLLDGEPVAGDAWRSQVAFLPQRPVFLPGSIADNLRVAAPGADEESLWRVLRRVALAERVAALPAGLDSPLGEDGAGLSAGERARLALARVVLSGRRWVLLDEPTAHVDPVTTRVIAETVADLARDRAVLVVAHRPELVDLADRVLTLAAPTGEPVAPTAAPTAAKPARPAPVPGEPDDEETPGPGLGAATVIGGLASTCGVALTATAGWLIVQASTHPPVLTLLVAVVSVRAFGIGRPALRYVERLWSHDAALRLLARRRVRVYDALVPLTPGALGRRRGDLLASVVDDVDAVVDEEIRVRLPLRGYAITLAVSTAVGLVVLPAAGLVVAATASLFPAGAYVLARAAATRAERRAVAARARLSTAAVDLLDGAAELQMWQRTSDGVAALTRAGDAHAAAARAATAGLAAGRALVLVGTGIGMVLVALLAADAHAAGTVSAPLVGLLVLLPLALGEVAAGVPEAGALAARCAAARARLEEIEHREPVVSDPDRPVDVPAGSAVSLDAISVGWGAEPAVTDLDLDLAPGERVGLVGPSGSGKSTVAGLLLRFLPARSGTATLGGVDLATLAGDDVRSRVGLVDDDPHLFASTLVENVRLARPGSSDDEVDRALRAARLGAWLDALPDGLDTWLGDGHGGVSGGERARIAIARCLLADQPVLVLDEPVAHLDHATAEDVAAEVLGGDPGGGGRGDRAVLWITHDPVGLDRVDRVLDLGIERDRGLAVGSSVKA
ncbi:thiol reductant ABC exporter subunit CydD, partial [Nocardioides sp. YIM 152588]|uniref:thiol reductant ABC exporter subunit CydD n=1 Tax=Nocardioides sp. YIM 152588 TaxID=3158259 RepID=UPI0032E3A463